MKRIASLLILATAAFASLAEAEPRRYIVEFADVPAALPGGRPAVERFRAEAPEGVRVRREYRRVLNAVAVELQEGESAATLARLPYVARVTPDADVEAYAARGGSQRPSGSVPVAASAATGAGIVVAVIDTGIDYRHPALGGGIGVGRKVRGGWDFANDDADPMDDGGHGTHVAGIIAGQSGELTGVAPGVTLVAYKVLDGTGRGRTSDVVAALELAIDPNRDGDSSDHVDIANLSLGTVGHPDDPMSRAVENAIAAGIVVCVAAGNEGSFHAVGSPGVAPSAITVGAVDAALTLAEFSSRGPAVVSGAVKPDVLAPGVGIRSTLPDATYGIRSGTSMATPYVSGVAALLLAGHSDWTPARVKAAITTTAQEIAAEEVMAQGAGAIDVARAQSSDVQAAPTQFNFGVDGLQGGSWQSVRAVAVRNDSNETREFRVKAATPMAGVTLTLPEAFTLAPGQSREVTVRLAVDNGAVGNPTTGSLAFGGTLLLEWNGGSLRLPWAFIRAARAVVAYENALPSVIWDVPLVRYQSSRWLGDAGLELLVEPGTYDLVVIAQDGDGAPHIVAAEKQRVEGDLRLAFGPADAPHELRLESLADRVPTATALRASSGRLIAPGGSIPLAIGGSAVFSSTLSERFTLLLTEAFVNVATHEMRVAQHAPLQGVTGSRVLRHAESEFASQEVVVRAPENAGGRTLSIMPREWPRSPDEFGPRPPEISATLPPGEWRGTLAMTAESHPDFGSGVQMAVRTAAGDPGETLLTTPVIRRDASGFFAQREFARNAAPSGVVAGEELTFQAGPLHMPSSLAIAGGSIAGSLDLRGDRNETVTLPLRYRIIDSENGAELASGNVSRGQTSLPLARKGAIEATLTTDAYLLAGKRGSASLTLHFDSRRGEFALPAITSLALLDGSGRHEATLPLNGNGAVIFSVRHAHAVGVFFRLRGRSSWVQLTPVETADDETVGKVYRVDVADALRFEGEVELRIEALGENDSAIVWQLAPGFVSEPADAGGKRRSIRSR